jgi:hypothetical protein
MGTLLRSRAVEAKILPEVNGDGPLVHQINDQAVIATPQVSDAFVGDSSENGICSS